MAAAEEDKEGIVVSGKGEGVDFGVIDTETAVEISITIQNTNSQPGYAVTLTSYRMCSSTRGDAHGEQFSARLKGKTNVVRPGTGAKVTRTISVSFQPSYPGQYEDTLELAFWHVELKRSFVITRRVKAVVGDREDHEQIGGAREAYTGPRRVERLSNTGLKIVRSLRPPTWTPTQWKETLPGYDVPARVIEAAFGRVDVARSKTAAKANVKSLMPGVFGTNTYGAWWQVLLYVEEEQVKQDLEQYALANAELKANYPRYE
jgi:helicase MOV-10